MKLPIITIIYGNIHYKELKNCKTFNIKTTKLDKLPTQNKPHSITIKHPNKDEINHCISFVFPIYKNNNPLLSAKLLILSSLLERPAFDELRTKAQLGYLVKCNLKLDEISYIKLSVQSALSVKKVEETMNLFINKHFNNILDKLDIKTFNQLKQSVYDNITEKDNSLVDMAYFYSNEILIQDYMFDRKIRIANKIKTVSLNDIKKLYHSIIKDKIIIKIV